MIYLGVSTLAFCLFPGTVYSLDLGEKIRQTVISLFDKKPGVQCDKYTDLQCPNNQVTFWLYTRDRQDDGYQFDPCDEATIRNAPFIRNLPVKVLVHGYTMNKDKAINEELRPAYFKSGDMNIISVDWSPISKEHCYTEAAYSIPTVGKCVAEFLKQVQRLRTQLGQMHMLGHSMGAHVVAWASLDLDLPRVTQFDPALPLFSDSDKHLFRRPKGTMVDVWHSNSGLKGRDDESGTVDLYLNDEMNQPGCSCDTSCSHLRAVKFYAETVADKKPLKAFPCQGFDEYVGNSCMMPTMETLADFGERPTEGVNGPYLTFTNAASPFLLNAEAFTNQESYENFKKTRDSNCPQHDFFKIVGEIVIGA